MIIHEDFQRCECDEAWIRVYTEVLVAKGSEYTDPKVIKIIDRYICQKCAQTRYKKERLPEEN